MTKKSYLSELRRRLCFRLSDAEIDDIISDMSECFDVGVSEGRTEDEIAVSLGTPKSAAAEIIDQRHSDKIFIPRMTKYILPYLFCLLILWLYFFGLQFAGNYILISIILPSVLWFTLVQTRFFTQMKTDDADWLSLIASALCLAGAWFYDDLVTSMLYDKPDTVRFTITVGALITLAMLLLSVTVWKRSVKLLAIIPLVAAGYGIYATVSGTHFLLAQNVEFASREYFAWTGTFANYFLNCIFVCILLLLVWSIYQKSAVTLPIMQLLIPISAKVMLAKDYYSKLDPTSFTATDNVHTIYTSSEFLWASLIGAAVTLTIVIIMRIKGRKVGEG